MKIRLLMALLLWLIPVISQAREAKENDRIEHLIRSVETFEGAVFIRNGKEYQPEAAGSHLRMKLEKAGDRVTTAEDFIEGIASKSSFSGKPYRIRRSDRTLTDTRRFFQSLLREYDKSNP